MKRHQLPIRSFIKLRPFSALREVFKDGYTSADLKADILAGIVVGMVAVPLGMALAIASGVTPQAGLYTVILAGFTVAMLGGSRCQVTGPTAAFVVILVPIVEKYGFGGLLTAGLMAGIILVGLGVLRLGQLIQFIPNPVTTGFTSGIAVVIGALQLKDFFGLKVGHMPENFLGRMGALFHARSSASLAEFLVGAGTLAILLLWPRVNKKIPAPLIALSTAAFAVKIIQMKFPGVEIATIQSRFKGIPATLPKFDFPWNFPGPGGQPFSMSMETIQLLLPSAFAIAMLGGIESLLSAVVADGMARTQHDPDAELVALGTGNILCPFFGAIAATGAIARTATNIRFGGKSPISSMTHAIFALMVLVLIAPVVSTLPMASLAALLMLVAYNMSEVKHFFHILKVAPRSDVAVLLSCFFLTTIFDMVVGVSVGMVLAAFLFMRRMAEFTSTEALSETDSGLGAGVKLPRGVILYHIAGPLFFGAAEKAVGAMRAITEDLRVIILEMEDVPVMDISGLVALETVIKRMNDGHKLVLLTGVREQPAALLQRSDLQSEKRVQICATLDEAVAVATRMVS